jgi:hypothetical protein
MLIATEAPPCMQVLTTARFVPSPARAHQGCRPVPAAEGGLIACLIARLLPKVG